MRFLANDAWEAELQLPGNGLYAFTVEAWPETFRTWLHELKRKIEVGREVSSPRPSPPRSARAARAS